MKKILILILMILLTACSSAAAGEDQGNDPVSRSNADGWVDIEDNVSSNETADSDIDDWFVTADEETEAPAASNETLSGENNAAPLQEIDPSTFDVSRLNYEEFDNLYGQIMYNGVPEDRNSQPLKNANGVWRYNLKMRYDDPSQGYMYDELGYAQMYVKGSDDPPIRITLHPRKASDGYEVWDETDESVGYVPFVGNIDDDDIIRLKGNNGALIVPEYYYAYQGKEYLFGKMWMSEEKFADFMMIREEQ